MLPCRSCYGTHSGNQSTTWSNTTVDDPHRSWAWLYCNELGARLRSACKVIVLKIGIGWYFSGAPPNWPTITSRLTTPDSEAVRIGPPTTPISSITHVDLFQRLCSLYFPNTFPMGITAEQTHNQTAFNQKYGGWSLNTTHTFFSTGRSEF